MTPEVPTTGSGARIERPRWRALAARAVFVALVALHLSFVLRGGSDPHARFAFRPFQHSDTWSAEIVRVTNDGRRLPIDDGTWAYDWRELTRIAQLQNHGSPRHASDGADATLDLLDRALDWVATHTPDDTDTRYLEATVIVRHDGAADTERHVVRSIERDPNVRAGS
ncbi:MAG: hypothetical protein S0880_33740 [Actinomycetota bacterium]|nr:hypothetical protein [Actinomycetota bacterium]